MGQRTAILLKKNFGHNRSTITLIHHQWGIGKTMLAYLLQEVLKADYPLDRNLMYLYSSELEKEGKVPLDYFYTFESLSNENNNYITNKQVATDDESEDIWRSEVRQRYGKITDNNNGMMLVEVTQLYKSAKEPVTSDGMFEVKVGLCLGNEETTDYMSDIKCELRLEQDFDRLVSIEEYINRTFESGGKSNNEFARYCKGLLKFFGVEVIYDKKGLKKREETEKRMKDCMSVIAEHTPKGQEIEVPEEFKDNVVLYR